VPPQKIVIVDAAQHVTADRLWAPVSLLAAGQSSAWAAGFLRDLFLDDTPSSRLRLFLSRRDTPRHPLVNEPEIEAWLVRRGFQSVLPREMTIREQARLFARAEVVVGANGAGLANLVFCPAGTKVLELFSPDWLGTYSWEVSSLRQHEYYYLIGAESLQRSEFGAYHIVLSDLTRLLELAGLLNKNFVYPTSSIMQACKNWRPYAADDKTHGRSDGSPARRRGALYAD
jgi:capsular polysaccharide biosynthesis protein